MAFVDTVRRLEHELDRLQEALSALHLTVTEDRPSEGEPALVDRVENQVCDLAGQLEEAATQVRGAAVAAENDDFGEVLAYFTRAQAALNLLSARYHGEFSAHDVVAELLQMGRERGRSWLAWSRVTKDAAERCSALIFRAQDALGQAWTGLGERLMAGSVTVRTVAAARTKRLREVT